MAKKSGYKLNPEGARGYRSQVTSFAQQGTRRDDYAPQVPNQEDQFAEMGDLVSSLKTFQEKFTKNARSKAAIAYQSLMAKGFDDAKIEEMVLNKAEGTGDLQGALARAVMNAYKGENAGIKLNNLYNEHILPQYKDENGKIDHTKFANADFETDLNDLEAKYNLGIDNIGGDSGKAAYAGSKVRMLNGIHAQKAISRGHNDSKVFRGIIVDKIDDALSRDGLQGRGIQEYENQVTKEIRKVGRDEKEISAKAIEEIIENIASKPVEMSTIEGEQQRQYSKKEVKDIFLDYATDKVNHFKALKDDPNYAGSIDYELMKTIALYLKRENPSTGLDSFTDPNYADKANNILDTITDITSDGLNTSKKGACARLAMEYGHNPDLLKGTKCSLSDKITTAEDIALAKQTVKENQIRIDRKEKEDNGGEYTYVDRYKTIAKVLKNSSEPDQEFVNVLSDLDTVFQSIKDNTYSEKSEDSVKLDKALAVYDVMVQDSGYDSFEGHLAGLGKNSAAAKNARILEQFIALEKRQQFLNTGTERSRASLIKQASSFENLNQNQRNTLIRRTRFVEDGSRPQSELGGATFGSSAFVDIGIEDALGERWSGSGKTILTQQATSYFYDKLALMQDVYKDDFTETDVTNLIEDAVAWAVTGWDSYDSKDIEGKSIEGTRILIPVGTFRIKKGGREEFYQRLDNMLTLFKEEYINEREGEGGVVLDFDEDVQFRYTLDADTRTLTIQFKEPNLKDQWDDYESQADGVPMRGIAVDMIDSLHTQDYYDKVRNDAVKIKQREMSYKKALKLGAYAKKSKLKDRVAKAKTLTELDDILDDKNLSQMREDINALTNAMAAGTGESVEKDKVLLKLWGILQESGVESDAFKKAQTEIGAYPEEYKQKQFDRKLDMIRRYIKMVEERSTPQARAMQQSELEGKKEQQAELLRIMNPQNKSLQKKTKEDK